MSTLDLKLLAIIDDLYRTRNVSQTAENLGLTQPTVSMSLARLRKHFSDPLFVKTPRGMEPTSHTDEIIERLRQAHELIRRSIAHREAFEAATSTRVLRISATDLGQVVVLPRLMQRLRETAPGVMVDYTNYSDRTARDLESGDTDLAVGFIPPLKTGFHRQKLFTERFVCVVRAGHPRVRGKLSLEAFQRELHLVVKTQATGHRILEKTLEQQGIDRSVGVRVPNYLGVATLLSSTDLVATVPERMAAVIAGSIQARVFPTPFDSPPYLVMQYWHARADRDPGNRWLRALLVELFSDARARPHAGS